MACLLACLLGGKQNHGDMKSHINCSQPKDHNLLIRREMLESCFSQMQNKVTKLIEMY